MGLSITRSVVEPHLSAGAEHLIVTTMLPEVFFVDGSSILTTARQGGFESTSQRWLVRRG